MMIHKYDAYHELEVTPNADNSFNATYFENIFDCTGNVVRRMPIGPTVVYATMEDLKWDCGIE